MLPELNSNQDLVRKLVNRELPSGPDTLTPLLQLLSNPNNPLFNSAELNKVRTELTLHLYQVLANPKTVNLIHLLFSLEKVTPLWEAMMRSIYEKQLESIKKRAEVIQKSFLIDNIKDLNEQLTLIFPQFLLGNTTELIFRPKCFSPNAGFSLVEEITRIVNESQLPGLGIRAKIWMGNNDFWSVKITLGEQFTRSLDTLATSGVDRSM